MGGGGDPTNTQYMNRQKSWHGSTCGGATCWCALGHISATHSWGRLTWLGSSFTCRVGLGRVGSSFTVKCVHMFSRLSLCPLFIVRGMQMFSSFYSLVKTHRHSLHLPTFTSTFFGDCSSLFASRRFLFSPCISSEEHFGLNVQLLSWLTAEETPIQAEKTKCL